MNYPHLHLMLNHAPVIAGVVAILLLGWALVTRRREMIRLALAVTFLTGLSAYPAYFTGDEAHDQLRKVQGFDHDMVEEHEEAADWAVYAMLGAAAVAAAGLWVSRQGREVPRWAGLLSMVVLLWAFSVVARTAYLGGMIRHPEAEGPLWAPPDLSKAVLLDSASAPRSGGDHGD